MVDLVVAYPHVSVTPPIGQLPTPHLFLNNSTKLGSNYTVFAPISLDTL